MPINANRFNVERVLCRRPIKAEARGAGDLAPNEIQEYLVRWAGWQAKFNTLIPQSDFVRFTKQQQLQLGGGGNE